MPFDPAAASNCAHKEMTVSDKQQPGHTLVLTVGQSPAEQNVHWPPERPELAICSYFPKSTTTIDSGCDLSCSSSTGSDHQSPDFTCRRVSTDDDTNFSCPSSVQSTINHNTSDFYKHQLAKTLAFQTRLAYIDPQKGKSNAIKIK